MGVCCRCPTNQHQWCGHGDIAVVRDQRRFDERLDSLEQLEAYPWPDFAQAVRARLDAGRDAYGDRSFDAEPAELAREIQEELEDVCGWAYVLWTRIRRLEAAFSARNDAGTQGMGDHEGAKNG